MSDTARPDVQLLELGVIDPLMDVVADAEKDNDRTSVWQYLQATKVEPSSCLTECIYQLVDNVFID